MRTTASSQLCDGQPHFFLVEPHYHSKVFLPPGIVQQCSFFSRWLVRGRGTQLVCRLFRVGRLQQSVNRSTTQSLNHSMSQHTTPHHHHTSPPHHHHTTPHHTTPHHTHTTPHHTTPHHTTPHHTTPHHTTPHHVGVLVCLTPKTCTHFSVAHDLSQPHGWCDVILMRARHTSRTSD